MFPHFKPIVFFLFATWMLTACQWDNHAPRPFSRIELDHQAWTFTGVDTLDEMRAEVPGTVHTDLMNAGVIPDPFRDNHALEMEWIETRDWEYMCSLNITQEQIGSDAVDLVFEGLDTYASISINGIEVTRTNNMFRTWRIEAKPHLHAGDNELKVRFHSAVSRHLNTSDSLGITYPADNDPTKTSPFVRKAAYHFGWDWAPRLVTSGIWKSVYLELHDVARITEVDVVQQSLSDSLAILDVAVQIQRYSSTPLELEVMGKTTVVKGNTTSIRIEIANPKCWWPNGSGDQPLYTVPVQLLSDGVVLDSLEKKIGLRTIELINGPDSIGTSFYFEVNGNPLFMKGANYVPQDVFLPRVKTSQYRELLSAAADANMNMLRVWGGGIYESDLFYELCDSLGLLVWQDFMFAGTMYPSDSDFIDNVKAEAQEQIRRLRHHPCLALWCGNNEIDVAWHNWGWQNKYGYSAQDSATMWNDYQSLFEEILPEIVKTESPAIPYVATSPQSNWGTPENFNHGTMHYWGVWHGREPIDSFRENVGRFMVEYGMQSYPDISTLEKFISPAHLSLDSPVIKNRQKSYIGNSEIERHITDLSIKSGTFMEFVNASQVAQARALEIAIESHLDSQGHCMGSLLWQLNDCWPGPSWSIIDHIGMKKPAYSVVQKSFGD